MEYLINFTVTMIFEDSQFGTMYIVNIKYQMMYFGLLFKKSSTLNRLQPLDSLVNSVGYVIYTQKEKKIQRTLVNTYYSYLHSLKFSWLVMYFGLEQFKNGLKKKKLCYWWYAYAAKIYFYLTEHAMYFWHIWPEVSYDI